MEWQRKLWNNNPKRYAIVSAVFYAVWMTLFTLGADLIRHQKIDRVSVIIAVIVWSLGGIFIGWTRYRRRMQQINEGGIEELVRQYQAEQTRGTSSSVESVHMQ